MAQYFQLASGGSSRYTTTAGNTYVPDFRGIIVVPTPDPARDIHDLQCGGCRLLNADGAQYYRLVGGSPNTTYTASPSNNKFTTDDNGVTLCPTSFSADAQSLLGQGFTLDGVA